MKFYVYTWAYPNEVVFYVGKGTGSRMYMHELEAVNGNTSLKCAIIRHILSWGEEPVITKVYETDNEQDALLYEWALINLVYGIVNLSNLKGAETILTPQHRRSIKQPDTGGRYKAYKGFYYEIKSYPREQDRPLMYIEWLGGYPRIPTDELIQLRKEILALEQI